MPEPSYCIDAAFPGGNIIVDQLQPDLARIRPDLRDTEGNWFYWCFRVRGAQARTIRFDFTAQSPVGARGPAISRDGGWNWQWLGHERATDSGFEYSFTANEGEVLFGLGMTYTQRHFDRFDRTLPSSFQQKTLCSSRNGRPVALLLFGNKSATHRLIVTARHHCCEMMASYELEGLLSAMGADPWFGENVAAFVVPFVDKDGVEDGDQGKNRRPRDHNRDYDGASVHVETAAIREQLPQWLAGRNPDVFLDLHCPWIRGGINEITYQVGSPSPANWGQQQRFAAALEANCRGPLPYRACNDLPFGKDWNVASNNSAGMSSTAFGREVLNAKLSTTIELPYANSSGAGVNADSARAFGRDVANALRAYLAQA